MSLDLAVAQSLFRVRMLERTLNDPGPWTMSYAGISTPAVRFITSDRVIFRAHFTDELWPQQSQPSLMLLCRDEVVSIRACGRPDDGEFDVEWVMSVLQPISA